MVHAESYGEVILAFAANLDEVHNLGESRRSNLIYGTPRTANNYSSTPFWCQGVTPK